MSLPEEQIRERLAPILLRPLSPSERRRIAETLEEIAARQRAIADAAEGKVPAGRPAEE